LPYLSTLNKWQHVDDLNGRRIFVRDWVKFQCDSVQAKLAQQLPRRVKDEKLFGTILRKKRKKGTDFFCLLLGSIPKITFTRIGKKQPKVKNKTPAQ
tara:strand:- start:477 stop:767 length:291 start_codon:yes stop_codon:yes gene_type:complete